MKISKLIALAAQHEFERDPGLLGVRLSPIAVRSTDAQQIVSDAIATLGKKIHVAVSVPGLTREERDRVCLAPDERAAEVATQWRNSVRVADGERILYVSAEPHGKAGGLQDTLFPIEEAVLRRTLLEWAQTPASGLPSGLGQALIESGVADRATSGALCAYVAAVLGEPKGTSKWEAAGRNLPILGFAADTRLKGTDGVVRLKINAELVMKAATAESRNQKLAAKAPVVANLVAALQRSSHVDLQRQLASVDLGELTTDALQKAKAPEKKLKAPKAPARDSRKAPEKKVAGRRAAKEARRPSAEARRAQKQVDAIFDREGSSREDALARQANEALKPASGRGKVKPGQGGDALVAKPAPVVWNEALQRDEFGETNIPAGIAEVVVELTLRGGTGALRWDVQKDPRASLLKLAQNAVQSQEALPESAKLRTALDGWAASRRELVELLAPQGDPKPLLAFLRAPLVALGSPDLRQRVASYLEASLRLYAAAGEEDEEAVQRAVLRIETGTIIGKDGQQIVLLGALHPLWLSQVSSRYSAMLAEPKLEREARGVLARSLTEAPAAPQTWPGIACELVLSRAESGLIVYEREAATADPETLIYAGDRLASRYLELLPHARLGLCIAVKGEGGAHFVEGVASAISRESDVVRAEILYEGSSLNLDGKATNEQMASGRLLVRPLPASGDGASPHLSVHIVPPPLRPESEEAAVPEVSVQAAGAGLLPTEFVVRQRGLSARMPLEGHKMLQAVEMLHALSRGRTPQNYFVADATVALLSSVLPQPLAPKGTWHVAIGRRLGRQVPPQSYLVAHERISETAQFVVVADNINPVGRALEPGFKNIGVNDLRPSILRVLASRLAEGSASGLVSLSEDAEDSLIARGLLGLYLKREIGRTGACVLAPVERASAASVLLGGEMHEDGVMMLALAAVSGVLRVTIGYATLASTSPIEVERGQATGGLADQFSRIATVIGLASSSQTLGGIASREALNWLLWPAIAAAEVQDAELLRLVRGLGRGTETAVDVTCLTPPTNIMSKRGDVKIGKLAVRNRALDLTLFEQLVLASA